MISKVALIATVLTAMTALGNGVIMQRCELAKELVENGFSKKSIPDWICLVQHESSYDTRAVHKNVGGTIDYGIFQINNGYWCSPGRYNECHIPCSKLIDDNISDDIKCAKLIFSRQGFNGWYGWRNNCRGRDLSIYVKGCKY